MPKRVRTVRRFRNETRPQSSLAECSLDQGPRPPPRSALGPAPPTGPHRSDRRRHRHIVATRRGIHPRNRTLRLPRHLVDHSRSVSSSARCRCALIIQVLHSSDPVLSISSRTIVYRFGADGPALAVRGAHRAVGQRGDEQLMESIRSAAAARRRGISKCCNCPGGRQVSIWRVEDY